MTTVSHNCNLDILIHDRLLDAHVLDREVAKKPKKGMHSPTINRLIGVVSDQMPSGIRTDGYVHYTLRLSSIRVRSTDNGENVKTHFQIRDLVYM